MKLRGLYRDCIGIHGAYGDAMQIMLGWGEISQVEDPMKKKMKHEMETLAPFKSKGIYIYMHIYRNCTWVLQQQWRFKWKMQWKMP